jgi:phage shock protein A
MMKRFIRWLRSVFGGAVDSLEDPEKILQQNIRDMNDQIPVMNENIATVKANVNLSENSVKKLRETEQQLRAKIKAALTSGRRDMALNFATTLEQVQADITAAEAGHELALRSHEKALKVKEAFMAERDRKIKEAMRAISMSKQAEWQTKVAKTMQTFEVADIDHTHDEMIRKIEEKVAKSQARLEMALGSQKVEEIEIEKEAQRLQANETLKQFEIELGLVSPGAVETAKTMGPVEKELSSTPAENAGTAASAREKVRE